MLEEPSDWPDDVRRVYRGLQSYEIVGASSCVAAIVDALRALASAKESAPTIIEDLNGAAERFCALKPDTAAYRNACTWLLRGLDATRPETVAVAVARRANAFLDYRHLSLERLAAVGDHVLSGARTVLVHDYSSSVLRLLERRNESDVRRRVFVTWGQPLDLGPLVARRAAEQGHHVTLIPDTAIGRTMPEVDAVLSGVEVLYQDGSCSNTVGTYPIALVAKEANVCFYGVSECIKIGPQLVSGSEALGARLLRPWPPSSDLQPGIEVRSEVLDWTPASLVSAYITERGLLRPETVADVLAALLGDLEHAVSHAA